MWHFKDTTAMQYIWLGVILTAVMGFGGVAVMG